MKAFQERCSEMKQKTSHPAWPAHPWWQTFLPHPALPALVLSTAGGPAKPCGLATLGENWQGAVVSAKNREYVWTWSESYITVQNFYLPTEILLSFFFFFSSHFNVNVSALKCFRLLSIYFSVLQWAGIKRKQHKQTKTKQIKAAASFPSLTGMLLWMGQSKSPPKASQPALKRQHLTHAGQSPWCWALLCCGSSIHHTACPWAEGRLDQLPCWCRCCGVSYATGNVKVVKPGCTGFTVVYSSQGANLGTPASEHGWQDLCVLLRSPVETCYPGMARVLWLVLGLTKHRCCWQENFFHYGFSWNSAVFQLGGYDLLTTRPHLVFNGLCCSCSNLLHLNPMVWVGRKMFPWILHIKANTSAWNMLARLGVRRKFLFATV